jgi:hypothetical protein
MDRQHVDTIQPAAPCWRSSRRKPPRIITRYGTAPCFFDAVIMGDEQWLAANAGGGAVPSVEAVMRVYVDRGPQGL